MEVGRWFGKKLFQNASTLYAFLTECLSNIMEVHQILFKYQLFPVTQKLLEGTLASNFPSNQRVVNRSRRVRPKEVEESMKKEYEVWRKSTAESARAAINISRCRHYFLGLARHKREITSVNPSWICLKSRRAFAFYLKSVHWPRRQLAVLSSPKLWNFRRSRARVRTVGVVTNCKEDFKRFTKPMFPRGNLLWKSLLNDLEFGLSE